MENTSQHTRLRLTETEAHVTLKATQKDIQMTQTDLFVDKHMAAHADTYHRHTIREEHRQPHR